MNAITAEHQSKLASEVQRNLAGGVTPERVDSFLDTILGLAVELGRVTCTIVNEDTLQVKAGDTPLFETPISRAKTKLRMVCARLAVRGQAWAGHEVSPYGDVLELEEPRSKQLCKISFENTT